MSTPKYRKGDRFTLKSKLSLYKEWKTVEIIGSPYRGAEEVFYPVLVNGKGFATLPEKNIPNNFDLVKPVEKGKNAKFKTGDIFHFDSVRTRHFYRDWKTVEIVGLPYETPLFFQGNFQGYDVYYPVLVNEEHYDVIPEMNLTVNFGNPVNVETHYLLIAVA